MRTGLLQRRAPRRSPLLGHRMAGEPGAWLRLAGWFALGGGPIAWAFEHVVGYGVTEASCDPVDRQWGIATHSWEIGLTTGAALIAACALATAVYVFLATRGVQREPWERMHTLAVGSIVVEIIFLCLALLAGIGAVATVGCRPS